MSSENLILVGMPGAGKSTIGILLAKELSKDFVDADVVIQAKEGRRLQDIINTDGLDHFKVIEEKHQSEMNFQNHIIATGGSACYYPAAMDHLKENGRIIFLDITLAALCDRIKDFATRGIAMKEGQTFADLYNEREPLYERIADITIDCSGKNQEVIIAEIVNILKG